MKTTFTHRTAAPRADKPVRDLTPDEKADNVARALAEVRAEKALDAALTDVLAGIGELVVREEAARQKLHAARAAVPHAHRHSAHMTLFTTDADGHEVPHTVVLIDASPEIQALMDQEVHLLTGLNWDGADADIRLGLLQRMERPASLATAASILEVLAPEALDHLRGWQDSINAGEAFASSMSVGRHAMRLVQDGYLMLPRDPLPAFDDLVRSRRQVPPGEPGTPAYVKAIMGEAYAVWLTQQER